MRKYLGELFESVRLDAVDLQRPLVYRYTHLHSFVQKSSHHVRADGSCRTCYENHDP